MALKVSRPLMYTCCIIPRTVNRMDFALVLRLRYRTQLTPKQIIPWAYPTQESPLKAEFFFWLVTEEEVMGITIRGI